MSKDYYEILGINREAAPEQIKKAYRQLALKYHPDVSKEPNAENQFKTITEAYSVLSDPQQKARYDQGPTGFVGMPFDVRDIFSQIFGGMNPEHFRAEGFHGFKDRSKDIISEIKLTFDEAVKGCKKEIKVEKKATCDTCNGSGYDEFETCKGCGGNGFILIRAAPFEIRRSCERCNGTGKTPTAKCEKCDGKGTITIGEEVVIVDIPAGVDTGLAMRLAGKGNPPNGDLIIRIEVDKHHFFHRKGGDLACTIPVSYSQLVLGDNVEIDGIDGKIKVEIPPETESGKSFRFEGAGVPSLNGNGRGDLRVMVKVKIPENPSKKYKDILKKLSELENEE